MSTNIPNNIELIDYSDPNNLQTTSVGLEEFLKTNKTTDSLWINVENIQGEEQTDRFLNHLGVHNILTESILDGDSRPKFQEFDNYYFFGIRAATGLEDNNFKTQEINFLLKKDFLVSTCTETSYHIDKLISKIKTHQETLKVENPDYLLYLIFECIIDDYFIHIEKAEESILSISMIEQDTKLNPLTLRKIELLKQEIHKLKKSLIPIKEFLAKMASGKYELVAKADAKYYDDLKNDCLTLIDECEYLQLKIESKTNMFFSVQGHRMNQIMQTLTVISAIFIPLTFIAGIYGMNFNFMPETNWKYGYFGVLALMAGMTFMMLRYFKKKKWF